MRLLLLRWLLLVFPSLTSCQAAAPHAQEQPASESLLAKADVSDSDLDLDDSVYASADTGGSTWMAQIQSQIQRKQEEAARKQAEELERQRTERAARERAKAQLAELYRREMMHEKNRGLAARGRLLMHGSLPQIELQTDTGRVDEARSRIIRRERRDEPQTKTMKESKEEDDQERTQWWGQHGVLPKFQPSIEERLREEQMKALKVLKETSDDRQGSQYEQAGPEKQMLFSMSQNLGSPDQHEDNEYEEAPRLQTAFAAAHDSDHGSIRADLVNEQYDHYHVEHEHESSSLDDDTDPNGVYGGPPPGTPDQNDVSQQPVVDGSGLYGSGTDQNAQDLTADDGQQPVTDGSGVYGSPGTADAGSETQDAHGTDTADKAQEDVKGTVINDQTEGDVRTVTVNMGPPGAGSSPPVDSPAPAPIVASETSQASAGDSPTSPEFMMQNVANVNTDGDGGEPQEVNSDASATFLEVRGSTPIGANEAKHPAAGHP